MSTPIQNSARKPPRWTLLCRVLAIYFAMLSPSSVAEILWNGDFSTGNFIQYHRYDDAKVTYFPSTPPYGRPTVPKNLPSGYKYSQSGNGELLEIVTSPTRGSTHSARFVVKSKANETEPDDCDPRNGGMCEKRRNNLWMQRTHARYYNALPHMGERWLSFSMYLPADFPADHIGTSFHNLISIKQEADSYAGSGYFRVGLYNGLWQIRHTWNPSRNGGSQPWQYGMFYAGNERGLPYPRRDSWPDGLADFPDISASHAALQSVNKGGWTDWVMHYKQDHRGSDQRGTGFLTLWKREDSGPWIKVLHIVPKQTTRGGITFNHGIGYNLSDTTWKGAGVNAGFYMSEKNVHSTIDMVYYMANIKIGNEKATFSQMSPDGSTPESAGQARPKPPTSPSAD
jgi:hypothetical protein